MPLIALMRLNCERLLRVTLQEESEVAEKYARLISSNQLSMDDVNEILSQHTRSVHLLRIRQGDERQRLLDRLDAKRQARRAAAGDDERGASDDDEIGKRTTSGHVSTRSDLLMSLRLPVSAPLHCSRQACTVISEFTMGPNNLRL